MPTPCSTHLILVILRSPSDSRLGEALRERMAHFEATALAKRVYLIPESRGVYTELRELTQQIARSGGEALLGRGALMRNHLSCRRRANALSRSV